MRTSLQILNDVRIATPCRASWGRMAGDDRVRHCRHCDKQVFDLSRLDADAAVKLLTDHDYDICVRLYRRRDGTVMTSDCAAPAWQRWPVVAWAVSLAAMLLTVGCQGVVAPKRLTGEPLMGAPRPTDSAPPATAPSDPACCD